MANMWWEPLKFEVQAAGPWIMVIDTAVEAGFLGAVASDQTVSPSVQVAPRSIVVLQRP